MWNKFCRIILSNYGPSRAQKDVDDKTQYEYTKVFSSWIYEYLKDTDRGLLIKSLYLIIIDMLPKCI